MVSDAVEPTAVYVVRSPADVLRLVVALACLVALLLIEWLFGDTLVGFASDLFRGLDALPDWIVDVLSAATRFLAALVLIAGLLFTVVRSGWRMLLTIALAVAIACALVAVFANLAEGRQGSTVVDVSTGLGPLTEPGFPTTFGITAFAAALTAGAPWLGRALSSLGLGGLDRHGVHALLLIGDLVRLVPRRAHRLGRRIGHARAARRAVRDDPLPTRSSALSPGWAWCSTSSAQSTSMPAGRRPTSGSAPTAADTS